MQTNQNQTITEERESQIIQLSRNPLTFLRHSTSYQSL